ncbi:Gfo/Idh/MocA family protein [Cytobacillus sp. Hm23]
MSRIIQVGVIGTGFGAKIHTPIINFHPNYKVSAISSVSRGNVQEIREKTGINNVYTNWENMIKDENLDLIVVASAPDQHSQMVCELLKNHSVLCEKPMAMNEEQALEMIQTRNQLGSYGAINFEFRFKPVRKKIKEIINSGLLGRIMHVRYAGHILNYQDHHSGRKSWKEDKKRGGGLLIAIGSHMIDSLHWWLNDPIQSVLSQTPIHVEKLNDREGNEYIRTADDSFQVLGQLNSGTTVTMEFISRGRHILNEWELEIYGTNGTLFMKDDKELFLGIKNGPLEKVQIHITEAPSDLPKDCQFFYDGITETLNQMLNWFNNKKTENLATFEDGYYVQKVLGKIQKSADTGKKEYIKL